MEIYIPLITEPLEGVCDRCCVLRYFRTVRLTVADGRGSNNFAVSIGTLSGPLRVLGSFATLNPKPLNPELQADVAIADCCPSHVRIMQEFQKKTDLKRSFGQRSKDGKVTYPKPKLNPNVKTSTP